MAYDGTFKLSLNEPGTSVVQLGTSTSTMCVLVRGRTAFRHLKSTADSGPPPRRLLHFSHHAFIYNNRYFVLLETCEDSGKSR